MFTELQKKWILALQSSNKIKTRLCVSNDDKFSHCCLGVAAECSGVPKVKMKENRLYAFTFEDRQSSTGMLLNYEKFNLHSASGLTINLTISINNNGINSLTTLNDRTELNHKQISKFIYVFREYIFDNFLPENSERKFLNFKSDQELIDYLDEQAPEFESQLKQWA